MMMLILHVWHETNEWFATHNVCYSWSYQPLCLFARSFLGIYEPKIEPKFFHVSIDLFADE